MCAPFRVSVHGEFRSLVRRIEISFRRELLCSTAQALERGPLVLVGLDGFPLEVAGGGRRAFAQESQQRLRSEFASATSSPAIDVTSVSQKHSGWENSYVRKSGPNRRGRSARGGAEQGIVQPFGTGSVSWVKVSVNGIGAPRGTSAELRKVPGQKRPLTVAIPVRLFTPISGTGYPANQTAEFTTRKEVLRRKPFDKPAA